MPPRHSGVRCLDFATDRLGKIGEVNFFTGTGSSGGATAFRLDVPAPLAAGHAMAAASAAEELA
jgi:hypothetical protein